MNRTDRQFVIAAVVAGGLLSWALSPLNPDFNTTESDRHAGPQLEWKSDTTFEASPVQRIWFVTGDSIAHCDTTGWFILRTITTSVRYPNTTIDRNFIRLDDDDGSWNYTGTTRERAESYATALRNHWVCGEVEP